MNDEERAKFLIKPLLDDMAKLQRQYAKDRMRMLGMPEDLIEAFIRAKEEEGNNEPA